jgi:hypothetical protein
VAIEVKCEFCGALQVVPDNRAGLVTVCECGEDVRIPDPSESDAAQPTMDVIDESVPRGEAEGLQDWEHLGAKSNPEEILRRAKESRPVRGDPSLKYKLIATAIFVGIAALVYLGIYLKGEGSGVAGPAIASQRFQTALAARSQSGLRDSLTPATRDAARLILQNHPDLLDAIANAHIGATHSEGDVAVVLATARPGAEEATPESPAIRRVPIAFGLRREGGQWLVDGAATMQTGCRALADFARLGDSATFPDPDDLARRVLSVMDDAD